VKETDYPSVGAAIHKADRTSLRRAQANGKFAANEESLTISEPGKYYLLVGSGSSDVNMEGATYLLTKQSYHDADTDQDAGSDIDSALPIRAQRYKTNYFPFDEDIDVYSFEAKKGEQYFVGIITDTDFNASISYKVTDDYGEELIRDGMKSGKSKTFTIPSDGKFFITLKGCCWSGKMEKYTLELKLVSTALEPTAAPATEETPAE